MKCGVWSVKTLLRLSLKKTACRGKDTVGTGFSSNYRSFIFGKLPPPACPGLCNNIDVLLLYCCFLPDTFLKFPRLKYHCHERAPCSQDCEVIGWAELCERKKLMSGSCFQLEWLGHSGPEEY